MSLGGAALADDIDALADGFSGAVSISRGGRIEFERAYGLADRAHAVATTPDTQFAIASGTKGFTALTIAALIAEGALSLRTTARPVLGSDLPLVAVDVTVEHLLAHRSGIGDYVDEAAEGLPLNVTVQNRLNTADYLPALDGIPTKFVADTQFAYCNSGFVVLALIAERVGGQPFHDQVRPGSWSRRGCRTPTSSARTNCRDVPRSATSPTGGPTCSTADTGQRRRRGVHDRRRHPIVLARTLR